jgi:hypothetical protein
VLEGCGFKQGVPEQAALHAGGMLHASEFQAQPWAAQGAGMGV